jgi:hypothetical protein
MLRGDIFWCTKLVSSQYGKGYLKVNLRCIHTSIHSITPGYYSMGFAHFERHSTCPKSLLELVEGEANQTIMIPWESHVLLPIKIPHVGD